MSVVSIPIDNDEIDTAMGNWRVLHWDYFGKCFSLILSKVCVRILCSAREESKPNSHISQDLRNQTIDYVEVETLMNTYVYVHHPGQVRTDGWI